MENVKHNGVKLGLYDTQWMNCVNDPQVLAWDTSKEDAVNRAVELAEKYCIENAKKAISAAEQAQQAEPVAFGDDVVQYISRWGGHCRDCADNMGICHTGLPCGDGAKAITHVLSALAYGINNGFLPRIAAKPPAVAVPDGYALVPIDPTSKMLMAADRVIWADADILGNYCNLWNAMLDASQKDAK